MKLRENVQIQESADDQPRVFSSSEIAVHDFAAAKLDFVFGLLAGHASTFTSSKRHTTLVRYVFNY